MARKIKKQTQGQLALQQALELWEMYEERGAHPITQEVENLYMKVFGDPLKPCSCKDRIGDALIAIITTLKKTNTIMADREYILKRGVIIHWKGETYSRINMTDEVAKEWAEVYPNADVWEAKPVAKAKAKQAAQEVAEETTIVSEKEDEH